VVRLLALIALPLVLPGVADAARCTGSANCRACTNCSRCAYCKGGGSCGACALDAVESCHFDGNRFRRCRKPIIANHQTEA
jgi:hypothetical protein